MRLHAFLFCFLFVTTAGAQQLPLETYNPSNGLVDARIRKIKQDKWGRLIFMCFEGFGIYDGQRFKNYKHVNGVPTGFLTEIAEDTDSTIYITGFNQYVFKIKGETISIDSSLRGKLPEPERLLNIGMHHWIVFGNGQIAEWRDNIIKNIQLPDFIDFVNYNMLDLYDNNLFFYNTIKGIFLIVNYKTGKITASLSSAPIASITADKEKNVFYKTTTGLFQLAAKDIAANRLTPINASHLLSLIPDRFKKAGVSYWEDNNHFWSFLYRLGACRINIKTGKPEFFLAKDGLSLSASNVFVDAEANYWFLSEFHGVQKLPQKRLEVLKKFGNDDASFTTLTYAYNNESFALQATTGHYLVKGNLSKKINVPANARFYWQNDWWASKDLVHFTSSKGYKVRPANTNNAYHFTRPELFKAMFDKNNNVLITGSSLVLIDSMHTVLFTSLPYFTDNITQDDDHLYWAFCRSGHVICYQRKGDNLVAASDTLHMPPLFSPRYALHWNRDTFFVGTRWNGLTIVSATKKELKLLKNITITDGLSDNFITNLAIDQQRQIWVGTGAGLDKLIYKKGDITIERVSSTNNLFHAISEINLINDSLLFYHAGDGSVVKVNQRSRNSNNYTPSFYFSEITVNDRPASLLLQQSFSAQQNNFSFRVSATSFIDQKNTRFVFHLSSKEKSWEQNGYNAMYNIANLSAGDFTLKVTVFYPGGIYPSNTITYQFTIRQPFWKQWWFIVLAIATAALILFSITRAYFVRKMEQQKAAAEKQQALEKERNRISRDIHDDLGSGLTKIAILSEVAKQQITNPDKVKEQLNNISSSSRELVDNLQDIIWVLNPQNDTLDSFAAYIREYALKFFEPLSVEVTFQYPAEFSTVKLGEEKRRNIFLTVKESFNNIAKHAWCNKLEIIITEAPEKVTIQIEDDGKGFNELQVRLFANGLKNMQNRIEQIGGQYTITSNPGKGTITTISVYT
jgi:signal transduction histidine kinase/ligand-binding sensor domain-containing protein